MCCPDALQKGCQASVVATINSVIFSLYFLINLLFSQKGLSYGSEIFHVDLRLKKIRLHLIFFGQHPFTPAMFYLVDTLEKIVLGF